jgi:hypothetical protein
MVKISRYAYLVFAWLFVIGVMVQVFLAGMVVVAREIPWNAHASLGHSLAGPLLLMLISMYLDKLPGRVKLLTWLLFRAYVLQSDVLIFLRNDAPMLSAFHPVMELIDFGLGWTLARRAIPLARETQVRGVSLSQTSTPSIS